MCTYHRYTHVHLNLTCNSIIWTVYVYIRTRNDPCTLSDVHIYSSCNQIIWTVYVYRIIWTVCVYRSYVIISSELYMCTSELDVHLIVYIDHFISSTHIQNDHFTYTERSFLVHIYRNDHFMKWSMYMCTRNEMIDFISSTHIQNELDVHLIVYIDHF